jgi:hypothetical protein
MFAPGTFTGTTNNNSTLGIVSAGVKPFVVVGGSYFTSDKIGPVHGGYKETWKSKVVNPRFISRVMVIKAKSPVNQVVRVNANANVAVNQTYRLRLDIKGSPALRFLNHQLYRTVDASSGLVGTDTTKVWRDPISVLLGWKEQVNSNPFLSQFVQARVYKHVVSTAATAIGVAATTTQVTITVTNTNMAVGQKVVGVGIPANSFISSLVSTTGIVVKYPTQAVAPTISGTVTVRAFTDIYSANEVAAFSGTNAYLSIYIPGTTIPTGLAANPTAYDPTGSDATAIGSQSTAGQESHIEFTMAYVDTTFGNATFTPMDKYDLEPLYAYASVVDELNNTNFSTSFAQNTTAVSSTNPYLSSHGIEMQTPVQTSGSGETVLRDLILANRYLQNAYPDSSRVESFRMREIEADPMLASVTRSSLYDQLIVVHNVPRWNNPNSMFDNDQYILQFFCAAGSTLDSTTTNNIAKYFVDAAVAAQGANSVVLELY